MSAQSPTISIIMTVYNREDLVAETIRSIRNQTYRQWELVVLDDGSEDRTAEVIMGFGDPRICYSRVEHTGISGSIKNLGLAAASGELIAFCDSDDLWHPQKLEKQLEVLKAFPGADYVLTGGYNFKNVNVPVAYFYRRRNGYRYGNLFRDFFSSHLTAMLQSLLMKKACLQMLQGFNEQPLSHIHFLLELARHYKGVITYEPLFYRRLHDHNFSRLHWIKRHREGLALMRSYKNALPAALYHDAIFRSHLHFAEKCISQKIYSEAYPGIFAAWRHKPLSMIPMKKLVKTGLAQLFK